ncbi:MAG: hypothetical protein AMJ66_11855 [Betaproteobacteria bacterium SG8_40]|nr:MAG: hypothetical protein AMJ66_11855 [Betaproteobacteria bacterium SG8_40]
MVLDSNVWLDWLFFDDPGVAGLKTARRDGAFEIIIDAACRNELVRVLDYESFALDQAAQAAMLDEADRLCCLLDNLCYPSAAALPFCTDPDDVKFLALAAAGNADWLITKDKALLGKPRQRRREAIGFRIATPQQWTVSHAHHPATPCHAAE